MPGILRASWRFFRDRRVLLGSLVIFLLSTGTEIFLYSLILHETIPPVWIPIVLVMGAVGWPVLWGSILAAAIVQDEMRTGALEMLLATPVSPLRLITAMSGVPTLIALLLICAGLPGMALGYILQAESLPHGPLVIGLGLLASLPLTALAVWVSVYCSASNSSIRSSLQEAVGWSIFALYLLLLVMLGVQVWLIGWNVWRQGFAFLVYMLVMFFMFSYNLRHKTPLVLETLRPGSTIHYGRIASLYALLRKSQETIFPREEGVSKYETVEEIRQQNSNGPLTQLRQIREITLVILFLLTPFLLPMIVIQAMGFAKGVWRAAFYSPAPPPCAKS